MTICIVGGIINFYVVLHIEIDDYSDYFQAKTVITVYLPSTSWNESFKGEKVSHVNLNKK